MDKMQGFSLFSQTNSEENNVYFYDSNSDDEDDNQFENFVISRSLVAKIHGNSDVISQKKGVKNI